MDTDTSMNQLLGSMKMQAHDYDKILYRLITIIGRLSDGEVA